MTISLVWLQGVAAAPLKPVSISMLHITTPAGGETWTIGQTKTITWTHSNVSGNLRLDLYRGGTAPQNKIGTITGNTAVATGSYLWEVGKYLGGKALPETGYIIVIKSDTPNLVKTSGSFSLAAAAPADSARPASQAVQLPSALKRISITDPRRAEMLHKGIPYTIKWTALNLNQAKLKLQLMNLQGTTVMRDIANDILNTGTHSWTPPMDLPDEKTFYKIRIQTTDGATSNLSDSFPIAKASATGNTLALELKNPPMGDRYTGDTIPIKWTTTINCSGAGGPTDEAFFIDLMNENGSTKVRTLADSVAIFDSEGPTGILNWHWDWLIESSQQPGTYMIQVRNWNGQCKAKGGNFRVMKPRQWVDMPQKSAAIAIYGSTNNSLTRTLEWGLGNAGAPHPILGPPSYAVVGQFSNYDGYNNTSLADFKFRSWVRFNNDPYWYEKLNGKVKQVKLAFNRKWKGSQPSVSPCLAKMAIIQTDNFSFPYFTYGAAPALSGAIPVSTSQGDTWEIYLTQYYLKLIEQKLPDNGIVLASQELMLTSNQMHRCSEGYQLKLHVQIESNE
jgi:hypothetical protein